MQGKCCICGEEAKSLYSSIFHVDNGKAHVYNGHKGCLSMLITKLKNGEKTEYEEVDISKF